jgi:tetratricopeptide (TPR) repeat protein
MDPHLAELSRTMDAQELGRRIRNARVAAGLTQGELAGADVTSAYISRIEAGQRRPEFGLLGRLAARMGTELGELLRDAPPPVRLDLLVALDHAELALAGGEPSKALKAADEIASELDGHGFSDLARRCNVVRATALEALGELNRAILLLEDLCREPDPSPEWLRCLIALSRCYRETGDLDRAIAVGEDVQRKLDELELAGLTEAIQLCVTVASAYMLRGDLDHAMRICLRAIEDAERVQSPIAKASAYWNASLIESRNGSNQVALDLARKALAHFEIGEDARNLARLRGHLADMQLELDPPDPIGAIETLRPAIQELEWSSGSAVDRASHLQTRARAHLLLGDDVLALRDIEASLEFAPADAVVERAYGYSVLGQVEMNRGRVEDARRAFLSAVQLLSGAGADREAAQLWFDLGVRLKQIGEVEAALDAFQRAAASTGLKAGSAQGAIAVGTT